MRPRTTTPLGRCMRRAALLAATVLVVASPALAQELPAPAAEPEVPPAVIGETVEDATGQVGDAIGDAVGDTGDAVGNTGPGPVDDAGDAVGDMGEGVGEVVGEVGEEVAETVDEVEDKAPGGGTPVGNFVNGLTEDLGVGYPGRGEGTESAGDESAPTRPHPRSDPVASTWGGTSQFGDALVHREASGAPSPQHHLRVRPEDDPTGGFAAEPVEAQGLIERLAQAAAEAAKKLAFPLALSLLVVGFLMTQGRLDRGDRKLILAPVDSEQELLSFK